MTGFLDLSREIRDMIYELCLVVDEVIIPYNELYPLDAVDLGFRKNMAAVALLCVCKIVESEAAEVLYGKNTWRITTKFPSKKSIWRRRARLFKHVVMTFSQRDVDPESLFIRSQEGQDSYDDTDSETDEPARQRDSMESMHDNVEYIMFQSWYTRINCMYRMPSLISVKLDVSRLYCYAGCCRRSTLKSLLTMLQNGSRAIPMSLWKKVDFRKVQKSITGIRNDKEKQLAQEWGFSTDFA